MKEKFCVNTEKRKMRAAKTCYAKIFYHGKKNSSLLFLASQIIGNNTSAHLQSD